MSKRAPSKSSGNKKHSSSKRKFKIGDIVLVKSPHSIGMPNTHVRLLKRVIVNPTKGKQVGLRRTMDWPGYSGWEAEVIYQNEIDILRKVWSVPFEGPGDKTFVYDSSIIKKPRKANEASEDQNTQRRRIVRKPV